MRRAIIAVWLWHSVALADTYYVSEGGNDQGPGSVGAPWGTLQKAADTLRPGDTVIVLPGSYVGFDLRRGGAPGQPITFRAQAGVNVTQDNGGTPDGINIEGVQTNPLSDIVVEGFTVNGRTRSGIRAVWCERCALRGNSTHSNGRWGIFTGFCNDIVIEGNLCSRSAAEHGIYVSNSADRPIIRGNVSYSNHANGIHMNGDIDTPCDAPGGAECDGVISGAMVEGNIIYDNGTGGGSGINGDGVRSSTFRNNLIYDSHASGISLYRIDGGDSSADNLVVNNTVVVAGDGRWALNIQDGSTGNRAFNNVLLNDSDRGAIDLSTDSVSGFIGDHNVVKDRFSLGGTFLTLTQWRAMTGQDADSIVATAAELFVGGSNHQLKAGSPAIGRADPAQAPATDLDGNARDSMPDVGAYEFGALPAVDAGPGRPDAPIATATDAGSLPGANNATATCGCQAGGAAGSGLAWLFVAALLRLGLRRPGAPSAPASWPSAPRATAPCRTPPRAPRGSAHRGHRAETPRPAPRSAGP